MEEIVTEASLSNLLQEARTLKIVNERNIMKCCQITTLYWYMYIYLNVTFWVSLIIEHIFSSEPYD